MRVFIFLAAWLMTIQVFGSIENFESLIEENCQIQREFAAAVLEATSENEDLKTSVHMRAYRKTNTPAAKVSLKLTNQRDSQ